VRVESAPMQVYMGSPYGTFSFLKKDFDAQTWTSPRPRIFAVGKNPHDTPQLFSREREKTLANRFFFGKTH